MSFFYRFFLRRFADRLVQSAYQGVLGRDADEAGLASYRSELLTHGLAYVINDLAESQEARNRFPMSSEQAEEHVRIVFRALLNRDPEPMAIQSYAVQMRDTASLQGLIAEVASSQEHSEANMAAQAEEYVRAVFRALLQREPEQDAIESYGKGLKGVAALERFICEVANSREHREKMRPALRPRAIERT